VFDGADDDAVDAPAEHPRIVANPAVQRVGDDRVAAELEMSMPLAWSKPTCPTTRPAWSTANMASNFCSGGWRCTACAAPTLTFSFDSEGIFSGEALDFERCVRMSSSRAAR